MAFSGLDVGITESILLLCAIVFGGIICSMIFLQCCRWTAEGRALEMWDVEHQRVLDEQRRHRASIDEAKNPGHKVEDSLSVVSPIYVQLASPQKMYESDSTINNSGTPGYVASAPPKPQPQIKIELPSNQGRWHALADYSVGIRPELAAMSQNQPLEIHQARSKSFMEEKHMDENDERRGKSFQFAQSEMGVTLKRVSSSNYDGKLVNGETTRLKLVDLIDKDNIRAESLDFGYERKTTEL